MNTEQKQITIKDTKQYNDLPFRGKLAIDDIVEYTIELAAEKNKLEKQVESLSNFHPVQKLKDYIGRPKIWEEEKDMWFGTKKDARGYTIYNPIVTPAQLQEWLDKNEPIYKENVEICKSNLAAQLLAFAFLKKLGLSEEKYDYPTNRSKNKQKMTCAWVGEIKSLFVTSCDYTWNDMGRWVKDETAKINEYFSKKKQEDEKLEREKQSKLKEQEKLAFIIRLIEKYKLNFDVPIPETCQVLSGLLKKNKYLYLAHYLAKNRGDWSDGHSYAESGLSYFVSKPEENYEGVDDAAIYENIQSYISDWQGDGRVFRDCEYNYDYLFQVAKENANELYDDYFKLQELCGNDL